MICSRLVFPNSVKSLFLLFHSVKRSFSQRGTVGSASACQARGHGFELGLKR